MDDGYRAVRILTRGKVQGVGFRYFVRRCAQQANVAGWVRNRGDDSVEIEAGGSREEITAFITQVEQGPAMARVDSTEIIELRDGRQWKEFEIVPTIW